MTDQAVDDYLYTAEINCILILCFLVITASTNPLLLEQLSHLYLFGSVGLNSFPLNSCFMLQNFQDQDRLY